LEFEFTFRRRQVYRIRGQHKNEQCGEVRVVLEGEKIGSHQEHFRSPFQIVSVVVYPSLSSLITIAISFGFQHQQYNCPECRYFLPVQLALLPQSNDGQSGSPTEAALRQCCFLRWHKSCRSDWRAEGFKRDFFDEKQKVDNYP